MVGFSANARENDFTSSTGGQVGGFTFDTNLASMHTYLGGTPPLCDDVNFICQLYDNLSLSRLVFCAGYLYLDTVGWLRIVCTFFGSEKRRSYVFVRSKDSFLPFLSFKS